MTVTLPLQPLEEAKLAAAAEAKGVSTELLVGEAVSKMLAEMELTEPVKRNSRSIREIFLEDIEDVPVEELENLPRDGASEHDHYLYGHAKRHA
jgi:hypothetical protein